MQALLIIQLLLAEDAGGLLRAINTSHSLTHGHFFCFQKKNNIYIYINMHFSSKRSCLHPITQCLQPASFTCDYCDKSDFDEVLV